MIYLMDHKIKQINLLPFHNVKEYDNIYLFHCTLYYHTEMYLK